MVSGKVKTRYRASSHDSYPHSFTLMNPGELHEGLIEGLQASYYSFYIPTELVAKLMSDSFDSQKLPSFKGPVIADSSLTDTFRDFVQFMSSPLASDSCFLVFLEQLIQQYTDTKHQLPADKSEPKAVQQITDFLHNHWEHPISLDDLSQLVGLSRSYLIRVFKRATGIPPHRYLLQIRLHQARKRLALGDSISQVAIQTGFADQSHFTRTFKAVFAMTPAQYAKVNFIQDSRITSLP